MAKPAKRREDTAVVSFESPTKPSQLLAQPSRGDSEQASKSAKRVMASASLAVIVLAAAIAIMSGVLDAAFWSSNIARELQASGRSDVGFDCDAARAHLTDANAVEGFHVLCIQLHATNPFEVLVTAHKDGMFTNETAEVDVLDFYSSIETMLEIAKPTDDLAIRYQQPYAFFSPEGERLESRLSALANRVVFLFEGGQFIWPGIKIGHKRVVPNLHGIGDVVMETLSMEPLVFTIEEFLRDEEIDVVLGLSLENLERSTVAAAGERQVSDVRTSSTYWVKSSFHEIIPGIDQRIADLVKVPTIHQNDLQVLRYEETQKYDQHLDYFPAEYYVNDTAMLNSIESGYKNRMITVFWYMSDVAKGGHTVFPRAGGLPQPSTMKDCTKGLKVAPQKRKVIVFYSMLPTGEPDPMSLHGGCPVEEGIKFSGNKWVWNKPVKP